MSSSPAFLFATCQIGAEAALKQELARTWPAFRFAYSRPGFLTFKLPTGAVPPDDLDLRSVFARAYGFSLGKATGGTREEMAREVWSLVGKLPVERLHVWPRDAHEPGSRDYEPGMTPAAEEIAAIIREAAPAGIRVDERETSNVERQASHEEVESSLDRQHSEFDARSQGGATPPDLPLNRGGTVETVVGRLVMDVVLVDEGEWWVGYHRVRSAVSAWPGGLFPESLPADAVSRVYLKMREAIRWAGFRIDPGARVAEIGCAPGGASQALLDLGAHVVGIDPAEMHPLVLGHPRFRHIRRRSKEVRRHEFPGIDWLTCDINLPPNYTLDTVEAVVSYPGVGLRGMLLTLKLIDGSMAAMIPEYLERVRSWGFRDVEARQLHHNRREVCIAASDFHPEAPKPFSAGEKKTGSKPRRGATAAQRKVNARPRRTKSKRIEKTRKER